MKVAKASVALSGDSAVAVGSTTKLTTTKKASSRAKITYTSSDDTIATVSEDGTVKGVKAGKATIKATLKIGKDTATATQEVEVKKYVLKSVAQTKADTFETSVTGATKEIKASEITVKNTENNVIVPVKSVSVDSKDATKVTFTTFAGLTDGKTYDVTLDGTTKQVVVSDGKVASVNVNKLTVPVATETEIKLVSKDANGVVLDESAYGSQDASKYDFSLTTANGYVNGSKLYLNKVGDTATAEITYKTNKYTADGKPDGNIGPNKVTITAADQATVSSFKVRIGENNKKYSTLKDNDKIAVDETKATWAYFEIKDTNGKEISNYNDYTVESSDKGTLMIAGNTMGSNHQVQLIPAKEGTAYIFIKKDDKIVASVPVTVVAARKVVTMSADKTSVIVSNASGANAEVVTFTTKDQYGNEFAFDPKDGKVLASCEGAPDGVTKSSVITPNPTQTGSKVKATFVGSDYSTKGTYTFKFTFVKDDKEVCAQIVTVNVQTPGVAGDSISYNLNINNSTGAAQTEEDAVVNADNMTARHFNISVSELLKGVEAQKLSSTSVLDDLTATESAAGKVASKVQGIYYTVKNAKGEVVYNDVPGATAKTGTAFSATAGQLKVDVVKTNGTFGSPAKDVYEKLADGTYTVTATVVVTPKHVSGVTVTDTKTVVTKSFVIKDSSNDAITDMKLKESSASVTTGTAISAALASQIQFSYDGVKYGADGDQSANIVAVEGYSNTTGIVTPIGSYGKVNKDNMNTPLAAGATVDVTKVTVRVAFHDASGNVKGWVDKEVNVSLTLTGK